MADGEDELQALVRDRAHELVLLVVAAAERAQLGLEGRAALGPAPLGADPVDRAVACRGDDPGRRVGRHAALRPALERDEERVLHGLLGTVEVAEDPGEDRDRLSRFAPEQAIDEKLRCSQAEASAPFIEPSSAA